MIFASKWYRYWQKEYPHRHTCIDPRTAVAPHHLLSKAPQISNQKFLRFLTIVCPVAESIPCLPWTEANVNDWLGTWGGGRGRVQCIISFVLAPICFWTWEWCNLFVRFFHMTFGRFDFFDFLPFDFYPIWLSDFWLFAFDFFLFWLSAVWLLSFWLFAVLTFYFWLSAVLTFRRFDFLPFDFLSFDF